MNTKVHEALTLTGIASGPQVDAALHWASRVANNLSSNKRYDVARRRLLEIINTNFGVLSDRHHTITARGAYDLIGWLNNYSARLSENQMVDGRQFVDAAHTLLGFVKGGSPRS